MTAIGCSGPRWRSATAHAWPYLWGEGEVVGCAPWRAGLVGGGRSGARVHRLRELVEVLLLDAEVMVRDCQHCHALGGRRLARAAGEHAVGGEGAADAELELQQLERGSERV